MVKPIHITIMSFAKWRTMSENYPYDHIVIGFRSSHTTYPPVVFSPYCKAHLELNVDDVHPTTAFPYEKVFTKKDAKKILKMVEKYKKKVQHIVCQCDAGVSRSAAVAAALSKILYGDDAWVFDCPRYIPNPHIYSTILNAHFGGYYE
jgi:predicted protein tyrosine phosphatase